MNLVRLAVSFGVAMAGCCGAQAATRLERAGITLPGEARSITAAYGGDGSRAANTSAVPTRSIADRLQTITFASTAPTGPSSSGKAESDAAEAVPAVQTANKPSQAIAVTSTAPIRSTVGSSDTPTATSGRALTVGASGGCGHSGGGVRSSAAETCAARAGSATYAAAPQALQAFAVGEVPSATLLSSSPNPSTFGQGVTFTATVAGSAAAAPTGTVSFKDGSDVLGSASLSALGGARSIAAGDAHTCAITSAGGVKCWGHNHLGQLGDGTNTRRFDPVDVSGLAGVVALAAGYNHTCALTGAGEAWCWGNNDNGQLGSGGASSSAVPVAVTGLGPAVAIAAGMHHTCAVTRTGNVMCWGANSGGELGPNAGSPIHPVPVDVGLSEVVGIAANQSHSCALTNGGTVKCWGLNYFGELGTSAHTRTSDPHPVPVDVGLSGIVGIAAGANHSCALTSGGSVKCWGLNYFGELGSTTNAGFSFPNPTPLDVSDLSGVVAIAAGGEHSCALTSDGGVRCWGHNDGGQLGAVTSLGTSNSNPTPVEAAGLSSGFALAAGYRHSCAVTSAGAVKCWGHNGHGQLGDGTQTGRYAPAGASGMGEGSTALAFSRATYSSSTLPGGTRSITAIYGGDDTYAASSSDPLTQTVASIDQTIAFTSTTPSGPSVGTTYTPAATASSGLPVSFGASGACSISGGLVTFTAAGTCTVTASQGGNASYNAAPDVTQAIGVAKSTPTVSVISSGSSATVMQSVTFTATLSGDGYNTASGTLAFDFGDGSPPAIATLSGGTATASHAYSAAGSFTVTASYGGDSNFASATGTLSQAVQKRTQSVSFASAAPVSAVIGGSYVPAASATSGLDVAFGASGGCSLSGGVVRLTGAGTCTVTASQAGNATYEAAADVTQGFAVGKAATATMLSSSNTSSTYGQSVTFTAYTTASAGGAPTGTVTFKDAGDVLGSATLTAFDGRPIASGYFHVCAITTGGAVACWGSNSFGQLGNGSTTDSHTPVSVEGIGGAVALGAGAVHSCAVTVGGAAKCWGLNFYGQLGSGSSDLSSTSPVDVVGLGSGVVAITAGEGHTCALTGLGTVKCWGDNTLGQLGDGTEGSDPVRVPVDVSGLTGVVAIGSGNYFNCALTSAGGVMCWGNNSVGQLGNGQTTRSAVPVEVSGVSGAVGLAVGETHSCALTGAGVKCWGFNSSGQLGADTNKVANPTPVAVAGLSDVTALTAGSAHTCALTSAGTVKCWGGNTSGVLGVPDGSNQPLPVEVPGLGGNVALVVAGGQRNCMADGTGALSCWGLSTTGTGSHVPAGVPGMGTGSTPVVFSRASYSTTALGGGRRSITAGYGGDAAHEGSSSNALTQTVAKANQTVAFSSVPPSGPAVGATYAPAATASSGLAVAFGTSGACSLSGAQVTFTAAGVCTVIASQAGNGNYNPAPQVSQAISVRKASSTMTVSASPAVARVGQSVTLLASLAAPSVVSPGGVITFKDGEIPLGSAPVVEGRAKIALASLSIGSHTITAVYEGDGNLGPSTATTGATITAAATAEPEQQVNGARSGAPWQPAIAALRKGLAIVWTADLAGGTGADVFLQRFNAAGNKAGGELRVNTEAAEDQSAPAIAGLAGGGFVVIWQSAKEDLSGLGIYGQMFQATGARNGAPFRINTTTRGSQSLPAVAGLEGGGFVVAWASAGQDGSGLGISAQLFDGSGRAQGGEFAVNTVTEASQSAPSVAALKNGGFVIAWHGPDASGTGIHLQRFDRAGRAVGAQTSVNKTAAGEQTRPALAALADGGFVVTWQSAQQDGSGLGVYLQGFTAEGRRSGAEIRVNTHTAGDQSGPKVAGFDDGGFVVTWSSKAQDGSGRGVYAQVFDAAHAPVDVEFLANTTTAGDQWQPAVAAFAAGRFAATWTSKAPGGAGQGIFVQRFDVLDAD